jgi:probable phosphoglycerate mutase
MPDKDASTPRVFLIRHGQTTWSISGQHTGTTDLPMTAEGEEQVRGTGRIAYGEGKLLDPRKIAKVLVSPRTRAIRTYELLSGRSEGYEISEALAEWDYGFVWALFFFPSFYSTSFIHSFIPSTIWIGKEEI